MFVSYFLYYLKQFLQLILRIDFKLVLFLTNFMKEKKRSKAKTESFK